MTDAQSSVESHAPSQSGTVVSASPKKMIHCLTVGCKGQKKPIEQKHKNKHKSRNHKNLIEEKYAQCTGENCDTCKSVK